MRDLGSGSAVLADADRKPCGEDVFGCVQIPVMGCSAVRARPCPDLETGHALRPGLRPAVGADLRARIIPVDGYELSPVPFGLVFEHSTELRPSGVHNAPVQPVFRGLAVGEPMVRIIRVGFRRASFGHVLHVEVFEYHRLVLADYPRAQLVEKVTAHVRDSGVGAGHLEGGFPMIVAALGLAGQLLLFPFEPLGEFLVVAWVRYGLAVAGDGVAVHAQVDSDGVVLLGESLDVLFYEDADVPASGCVQTHGHGARLRLAGQCSGPSYRQWSAHLGEREFVAFGIPFERASSVFGASAVGFGLEPRIVAGLLPPRPKGQGLRKPKKMKDFSNWLEAWKNYPPVPDWLNILGTIVIGVLLVLMAVGIIVGFIGAFLRDSLLFVRIIFISLVSGLIGVLLVMCVSGLIDNYYEQRSTAPPTIREQISKVWNLDDIDCDFSSKDKLPTEDLKCVVYRGDKKTKVTLHASENKLGLYTQDGKRFPIK